MSDNLALMLLFARRSSIANQALQLYFSASNEVELYNIGIGVARMQQLQDDVMESPRADNYHPRMISLRYSCKMFSMGGRRNNSSASISDGDTPPRRWGFNLPYSSVSMSVPDIIMISTDDDSTHALTPTDVEEPTILPSLHSV